MPYESALAGLQVIVVILNFGCLLMNLKIGLAVSDLRSEFLRIMGDHIRDFHNHGTRAPR